MPAEIMAPPNSKIKPKPHADPLFNALANGTAVKATTAPLPIVAVFRGCLLLNQYLIRLFEASSVPYFLRKSDFFSCQGLLEVSAGSKLPVLPDATLVTNSSVTNNKIDILFILKTRRQRYFAAGCSTIFTLL